MKKTMTAFGLAALMLGATACSDDHIEQSELPASVLSQLDPSLDIVVIDRAQWKEDPELDQQEEADRLGDAAVPGRAQTGSAPFGRAGEGGDWHEDSEQQMEREANQAAQDRDSACNHSDRYLDKWASKHVGCDVCVVFACGGGEYRHSCLTCQ